MSNPVAITSVFNDGYVAEAYEAYRRDPSQVDESWRQFFRFAEQIGGGQSGAAGVSPEQLRIAAGAAALADAVRQYGHLAVQLDPLGSAPPGAPELSPDFHGITEAELSSLSAAALGLGDGTAADAIARLRVLYSGRAGVEFGHIANGDERRWLREQVEGGALEPKLSADEQKALLRRLTEVDGLERALQLFFQGKKRFSIEGTDVLVPMLDAAIDGHIGAAGADVIIGMAHRGRLNVLTNVLGKPHATLFREFKGEHEPAANHADTGDVKYHMGWRGERPGPKGPVRVELLPNPSHLEFVNPVINGVARARGERGPGDVLTICVHGDAAFIGEGVVAETFNMARLRGFAVGGTLHVIANNQIGFTTDPIDSRSTHYASDLAKGFDVPVVHVNGDDPEACVTAIGFALAYRQRFSKDFLIDVVGYRRYGHNETDEPLYTQPEMYAGMKAKATPRQVWGARLVERGVLAQADVDAVDREVQDRYRAVFESIKPAPGIESATEIPDRGPAPAPKTIETAVPAERLASLGTALLKYPEGFTPNARLAKVLSRRGETLGPEGGIDWGNAEALAFASLVAEGTSVRLTGQDAERGTFGHRNAVLHDASSGATYTPLQHVEGAAGKFSVYNSPLSETSVMGFEYGYSVAAPDALALWEAQYGDFYNVAQTIIDQFVSSGFAKWGQESGLTLLLPHGYEGGGPEHSSARLERFLQMCADDNMIVAYPSTPAQYFHLLRRQAKATPRRPLVLMQPKWMLRLPEAASKLADLATGSFRPVLEDPTLGADAARSSVTRVVLSTAKIYHELSMVQGRPATVALVRIDELYPWPAAELSRVLALYPNARELVWAQEEPRNMGAWTYAAPRLAELTRTPVRYVGRPERASPAEGYESDHKAAQQRIAAEALGTVGTAPTDGASPDEAVKTTNNVDAAGNGASGDGRDAKGAAKGRKAAAR